MKIKIDLKKKFVSLPPEISKKGKFIEFLIALIFIVFGVSLRILPHPPNFAPIAAIALFGGAYLSKKTAFVLLMIAMLISDIFIGFYEVKLMAFVYGSFLICVVLGTWLKKNKSPLTVVGSSLLGSLLFFLLTNFAVWAFSPWYSKDFQGLAQSYLMGLPFFRNTILGDLFYVAVFFGLFELTEIWIKNKFKIYENKFSLV